MSEERRKRALLESFERACRRGDEWVRRECAVQALNSQASMYEDGANARADRAEEALAALSIRHEALQAYVAELEEASDVA
jgi:hypothetical protein